MKRLAEIWGAICKREGAFRVDKGDRRKAA